MRFTPQIHKMTEKIGTQAQALKAIRQARTVYLYGVNTGVYIRATKVQARHAVKSLPEFVDQWGGEYVRHSSENDLIIEV